MTGPSWPGTKTRVLRRRIASWAARGETRGPAAGVRSRGRKCNNELISVMAGDPGHGPAWPGVNWQGDIMSTLRPRHPDWWGTMNIVTLMRVCHSYSPGDGRGEMIFTDDAARASRRKHVDWSADRALSSNFLSDFLHDALDKVNTSN